MHLTKTRAVLIACTMLVACEGAELTAPQSAIGNQSEIAELRDTALSQALAIDEYLELLESRPAEVRDAPAEVEFRRYLDRQRMELRQISRNPALLSPVQAREELESSDPIDGHITARTDIFLVGPGSPKAVVSSRVGVPLVLIHKVSGEIETRGMRIPIGFEHASRPFPVLTWVTTIPLPEVTCSLHPARIRVSADHFSGIVTKLTETMRGYTRSGAMADCGGPITVSCPSSGSGGNNERVSVSLRGSLPEPDPCTEKNDATTSPGSGDTQGAAAFVCFTTEHWVRVYTIYNGIVLGYYDQFLYAERQCFEVA